MTYLSRLQNAGQNANIIIAKKFFQTVAKFKVLGNVCLRFLANLLILTDMKRKWKAVLQSEYTYFPYVLFAILRTSWP